MYKTKTNFKKINQNRKWCRRNSYPTWEKKSFPNWVARTNENPNKMLKCRE